MLNLVSVRRPAGHLTGPRRPMWKGSVVAQGGQGLLVRTVGELVLPLGLGEVPACHATGELDGELDAGSHS